MAPHRILYICSGNICRSPMAEALTASITAPYGIDVESRSAGTLGLVDRPADPLAIKVCRELGVDLRDHRSRGIDANLLAWADHILVMSVEHAMWIREHHDDPGERLRLLGPFAGVPEIPDPIGGWSWTFRRVRRQIEAGIQAFTRRVLAP